MIKTPPTTLTPQRNAAAVPATTIKPTSPGMRAMLFVASALVFIVGIPLYLLTSQTDIYFAWTIQSAMSTSFLGAAYWSSCALELLAAREPVWARARIAVPAVLSFTTLTLLVTLLHSDRFHFSAPALITRLGTWVWLAVYALVPLMMALLLLRQVHMPGGDPARRQMLPRWAYLLLIVQAAVMLGVGVALLVVPLAVAPLWPWTLTALSGRAVGAWLVGLGIAAAQMVWENDLVRLRPALVSMMIFSVLQFVALARYGGEVNWGGAGAWMYVLFLVYFFVVGGYGWLKGRALHVAPITT